MLVAPHVPVWSVVAGTTVVAVWNLVTRANGLGSGTGAGSEPVGYANALALLCVLGLVLLPALPRLAWPAAAPLVAVLVLQHSDGAYAALAVGVVAYVVRRRSLRLALVAAAVGLLLASPFFAGGHERNRYWRVAAREAHAHPLLGSGAGTYGNWWVRERTVPQQTQEAHSLYVETWAELGPFGLALVLVLLAVPLAVTRRPELAAGIAAYAAGAAVDFHWELAGVTAPALILVGLAVADPRRRRPLPVRGLALAVGVAALLAYLGNARLSAAQDAAQRGDFAAARSDAQAALRWQPYSPEPWRLLGDVSSSRAERVDAYRRATELDPADWSLWQRLGGVARGELRRLAEAKAAQLNPLGASGS
ncbi:MAG TPA: O-antigen ligase family protein [Gaiellaceae bacterium]|nr:O-antigen ligase family protein [Gaiellaceae bacterium]